LLEDFEQEVFEVEAGGGVEGDEAPGPDAP
jgi:hypothetical protein